MALRGVTKAQIPVTSNTEHGEPLRGQGPGDARSAQGTKESQNDTLAKSRPANEVSVTPSFMVKG